MKKIMLLVILSLVLFCSTSCTNTFDSMVEGEKVILNGSNLEEYLKINIDVKGKENFDDKITGVSCKVTCKGYDKYLSYFNVKLNYTFTVNVLNEDGNYVTETFKVYIELDENGNGKAKEDIKFSCLYRNVGQFSWKVHADGFVVKL